MPNRDAAAGGALAGHASRLGGPTRRAALTGLGGALLAACTDGGSGDPSPSATPTALPTPTPLPSAQRRLVWATWPEYIDVDDSGSQRPSLDRFTAETGIPVTYEEVIEDNEEYVATIADDLAAKRPVGADILTLTTWMTARLARSGQLQPFGPVPNAKNLIPALAAPDWDPQQRLSLPWQAGLTGITYDARRVGRAIGSVEELFTRPDLKGKVGFFTDFNDSIGLTLRSQGNDLATATPDDVSAATALLRDATERGQIAGFYGNDYLEALDSGALVASLGWSGDILQAQADNPYLKFVPPEEGLVIWSDNLVVPAGSLQAATVTALADYYYQPEVAATVAAWVNYICPVQGAQEAMERLDPDLAASPLIFPDSSILDRCYQLPTFAADDELRVRDEFAAMVAASRR
ncbi:ABC transporter substrate-binding protein [Ornithinibacter aureus]|uniref:ABC transporter substrate-binding protein n=1 Tax=Ornithinibacter aureus TaxID=622664 RepID=UPI00135812BA|nr:spermidine/putrescine ABC transporter substrate-binding protein [Ornithinibacter aureus]KAF0834407.1 spermidine/putrescine-binding protein [Ornithinibacter aureus]